jgi:DNA-binding transcriptional MerR regulator
MRIGELARRVHVNPKTVRYYESIGVLPAPDRTGSGYRVYTAADEELLAFIKAAQRLGMRLDEIREIIALRERGQAPCDYVRQILRREVAEIEHRIGELERLRQELAELFTVPRARPEPDSAIGTVYVFPNGVRPDGPPAHGSPARHLRQRRRRPLLHPLGQLACS